MATRSAYPSRCGREPAVRKRRCFRRNRARRRAKLPSLRRFLLPCVLLLFGVWALSAARAQLSTATVNGHVQDVTGANIPNATVTLRNVGTSIEMKTVTNAAGAYAFVNVPPGSYTLSADAKGFKTTDIPGFTLTVGQVARFEIPMAVASATTVVNVGSSITQMNTTSASLGTVIMTRQVNDLPLNGRNFTQLLLLTPGASRVNVAQSATIGVMPVSQGATTVFPAMNGQDNRSDLFLLDGLNDNETSRSTYAVPPIIDAIQEFKVESHTDNPASGGALGGVVNVVTRSGTSQFHGSAWEFDRNTIFDARAHFLPQSQPRPSYSQNQFGATLGGPVWLPKFANLRSKTFFFGAYQGFRFSQDANVLMRVPTAAELAGDESSWPTQLYNPFTTHPDPARPGVFLRDPFPGNQIRSSMDPRMVAYAKFLYPVAGPVLDGAGDNAQFTSKNTQTMNEWSIRVDRRIGANDSAWLRYSATDSESGAPVTLPGLRQQNNIHAQNWGGSYVHVFSPSLTLQVQFGRTHTSRNLIQSFTKSISDIYGQVGFANTFAGSFSSVNLNGGRLLPTVSITGLSGGGETYNLFPDTTSIYSESADLTKVLGNHVIRFGGGFGSNLAHLAIATSAVSFGNLETANTDPTDKVNTGDAFASFLLGVPTGANRRNETVKMRFGGAGYGYVADSWKVSGKLTLNYGLRYDFILKPALGKPGAVNTGYYTGDMDFRTGNYIVQAVPPLCSAAGAAPCMPGDGTLPAHVVVSSNHKIGNNQYREFGPRVGFAYQLSTDTVARGAAGIVYDTWAALTQQTQGTAGTWPDTAFQIASNLNRPTSGNPTPTATVQDPFAGPGGSSSALPPASPFTAAGPYFDPNMKYPMSYQWNLGVEQRLNSSTTTTLNYVGSVTRRLDMGGFYNTAMTPGLGKPQSRAPFSYMVPTTYDRSFGGGASYNALQASLNRRSANGLQYGVSYTWSKAMDIGTDGFFGVEGSDPQDPYDPAKYDRSVAGFDLTNIFTVDAIYQIPVGRGQKFSTGNHVADYTLGNWQLNSIVSGTSGTPFFPTVSGDIANTGNGRTYEHANLVGNPHLQKRGAAEWFNKAAFAVPAKYTYGNDSRNSLRSQPYWNFDLSLFRLFPIGEGRAVEMRAEAFNVLNHPVLGVPSRAQLDASSPRTFGTINTTASTARQLQLAVKFHF